MVNIAGLERRLSLKDYNELRHIINPLQADHVNPSISRSHFNSKKSCRNQNVSFPLFTQHNSDTESLLHQHSIPLHQHSICVWNVGATTIQYHVLYIGSINPLPAGKLGNFHSL